MFFHQKVSVPFFRSVFLLCCVSVSETIVQIRLIRLEIHAIEKLCSADVTEVAGKPKNFSTNSAKKSRKDSARNHLNQFLLFLRLDGLGRLCSRLEGRKNGNYTIYPLRTKCFSKFFAFSAAAKNLRQPKFFGIVNLKHVRLLEHGKMHLTDA